MQDEVKFIDLFCGIGGFHLGLQKASSRYKCVFANDIDPAACKMYWENFDEDVLNWNDIRKIDKRTIPEFNLLCGGFPCQAFSIAGNRAGFQDPRGTLFFEICEVLRIHKPEYLWLENVKGLLNHDGGQTFYTILRCLDELGYNCQWQLLDSRNFGVPQHRERVYIIGYLRNKGNRLKIFPIRSGYTKVTEKREFIGIVSSDNGIAGTLDANYWKGVANQQRTVVRTKDGKLRMLTPLECERLQGFPDNWTYGKDKRNSDMERYHALGNAVTVNVIQAIAEILIKQI